MAGRVTYLSIEDFFGKKVDLADLGNPLQLDLLSAQAFIPLDICALREITGDQIQNLAAHGGIMAVDSTPLLKRVNAATDKALRIEWAAGNSNEAQFPPVPLPPDLDPDKDAMVHLLVQRNTGTDTCQIDVQAFEGIGDTEMGGLTDALATTDLTEVTVTLGSSDITGHPGFLNLSLVPAAHATDKLWLYAAWIEYTRKLRTS